LGNAARPDSTTERLRSAPDPWHQLGLASLTARKQDVLWDYFITVGQ
jgi:hypothetical protein